MCQKSQLNLKHYILKHITYSIDLMKIVFQHMKPTKSQADAIVKSLEKQRIASIKKDQYYGYLEQAFGSL
jgi:hypothetical protein